MTTTTVTSPTTAVPATHDQASGRRLSRAACVVGAAAATGAIFAAGRAAGADFTIADPGATTEPHTFVLTEIVMVTAVIALAGWAALALLERFTRRAKVIWSVLATAIVLLSIPPIWIERATTDTRFFLLAIHVAVGAALVPMVRRS